MGKMKNLLINFCEVSGIDQATAQKIDDDEIRRYMEAYKLENVADSFLDELDAPDGIMREVSA